MVENIVAIELAYINTKHPDFHKEAVLAGSLMGTQAEDKSGVARRLLGGDSRAPSSAASNNRILLNGMGADKEDTLPKV